MGHYLRYSPLFFKSLRRRCLFFSDVTDEIVPTAKRYLAIGYLLQKIAIFNPDAKRLTAIGDTPLVVVLETWRNDLKVHSACFIQQLLLNEVREVECDKIRFCIRFFRVALGLRRNTLDARIFQHRYKFLSAFPYADVFSEND